MVFDRGSIRSCPRFANGRESVASAPRVCFIAESQAGIGSISSTLKPLALRSENPLVQWADVTYYREGGWLEQLPRWAPFRGIARGYLQTREALRRGPFDALIFLTHNPAVVHH